MMKLRLDDLQVDSFAVEGPNVVRGTVRANDDTGNYSACYADCTSYMDSGCEGCMVSGNTCSNDPCSCFTCLNRDCQGVSTDCGIGGGPSGASTCAQWATCEPFGVKTCGYLCPQQTA